MRPQQRAVLFVVSIFHYHREALPVVEEFAAAGWRVGVILGWLGDTADEARLTYESLRCEILNLSDSLKYKGAIGASGPKRAAHRRSSILKRLVVAGLCAARMFKTKRAVAALIRAFSPDVLMFGPFHSCGTFDNAALHVARGCGIVACSFPVSAYHGRRGSIRGRFNQLRLGMAPPTLWADYDLLNRFAAILFRSWTQERDGRCVFMFDPVQMLAAKTTGLLDADVWQKPNTQLDRVFVFTDFSKGLLAASEYDLSKVDVVGIPLLDQVIERLSDEPYKRSVFQELDLDENADFILFNVEPSAEHHYCDWDTHWRRFREMMVCASALARPVVLSLHPLCKLEDYLFAEHEFGVRISRRLKIYDLYPYCRLAISFPCSTNILAELFGKPLVVYDYQRLAAPDALTADEFRLPFAQIGHEASEVARLLSLELASREDAKPLAAPSGGASTKIRRRVDELLDAAELDGRDRKR